MSAAVRASVVRSVARSLVAHPPRRLMALSTTRSTPGATATRRSGAGAAAMMVAAASTNHLHFFTNLGDAAAVVYSSTTNRWFCAAVDGGDDIDTAKNGGTRTAASSSAGTTNPAGAPDGTINGSGAGGGDDAEEPVGSPNEETTKKKPTKEEQLEAEIKQLKDHLLRTLADQENTRRIAQNDVGAAKKFAIKSFAKSLLDVSDNLERALQAIPEGIEKQREDQPVLVNLLEGVKLTEDGLLKAFQANGLVRFGEIGDAFDPNRHDALFEYADPKLPSGTVGQVLKSGFLLNQRVLRPAEVGVVKNHPNDKNESKEQETEAEKK